MAEDEDLTYAAQSAPGSEAVFTTDSGGDVHYHFPIHVVVVGEPNAHLRSEIETSIMSSLYSALI